MSIRAKLIFGFALLAALMALQSALSFYFNDRTMELVEDGIQRYHQASQAVALLVRHAEQLRRYEKEYFIYVAQDGNQNAYSQKWEATLSETRQQLQSMLANRERLYQTDELAQFSLWAAALDFYSAEFQRIMQLPADPKRSIGALNGEISAGKERLAVLFNGSDAMLDRLLVESRLAGKESAANYHQAEWIFLALTMLGIGGALGLIFFMPGAIAQSLHELIERAEQMSKGALDQPIRVTSVPEFDRLARTLERLRITQLAMAERLGRRQTP